MNLLKRRTFHKEYLFAKKLCLLRNKKPENEQFSEGLLGEFNTQNGLFYCPHSIGFWRCFFFQNCNQFCHCTHHCDTKDQLFKSKIVSENVWRCSSIKAPLFAEKLPFYHTCWTKYFVLKKKENYCHWLTFFDKNLGFLENFRNFDCTVLHTKMFLSQYLSYRQVACQTMITKKTTLTKTGCFYLLRFSFILATVSVMSIFENVSID